MYCQYEFRIDACRGDALLMWFADHISKSDQRASRWRCWIASCHARRSCQAVGHGFIRHAVQVELHVKVVQVATLASANYRRSVDGHSSIAPRIHGRRLAEPASTIASTDQAKEQNKHRSFHGETSPAQGRRAHDLPKAARLRGSTRGVLRRIKCSESRMSFTVHGSSESARTNRHGVKNRTADLLFSSRRSKLRLPHRYGNRSILSPSAQARRFCQRQNARRDYPPARRQGQRQSCQGDVDGRLASFAAVAFHGARDSEVSTGVGIPC